MDTCGFSKKTLAGGLRRILGEVAKVNQAILLRRLAAFMGSPILASALLVLAALTSGGCAVDSSSPTELIRDCYGKLRGDFLAKTPDEIPFCFVDASSIAESRVALKVFDPAEYCGWARGRKICATWVSGYVPMVSVLEMGTDYAIAEATGSVEPHAPGKFFFGHEFTRKYRHRIELRRIGGRWRIAAIRDSVSGQINRSTGSPINLAPYLRGQPMNLGIFLSLF